jgi:hypothetical protein
MGMVMIASGDNLRVLSQLPGRMRLHLSGWTRGSAELIENRLGRINGVESVEANPLTRNILVHFDPLVMDADVLVAKINVVVVELPDDEGSVSADECCSDQPANAGRSLLRVGVRGLLGHAVVDSLWFGAGFLGSAMGLPLAGLGPLHVLMDVAVWTMAFTDEQGHS